MLFGFYVVYAIFPIFIFCKLTFEVNHRECFAAFLRITRTYVYTVAASQAVEYVNLHTECHTVECLAYSFELVELGTLLLFCIENKRTDSSVRTNIRTLVTLNTVFRIPCRNESCNTTFLIFCCTYFPSTVFNALECRNRKLVTVLSIDRTNDFVDESRSVVVGC